LPFPVVASFFGDSLEDFTEIAEILTEAGADALELNASCPNVLEEMGMLASDPDNLEKVVRSIKEITHLPLFVKLSPNVTDIKEVAIVAENSGADVITATNTLMGIAISPEFKRPILTNTTGGLSGPALKPISLRCVWEIAEVVDIPIIGCGGVTNWRDAVEYILAGASAVQIGTAIQSRGLKVFQEVSQGIKEYMSCNGYSELMDFIGVAHDTRKN
jgi:dihydroorotate dehydrogenase (NAD+) catalytic subunit